MATGSPPASTKPRPLALIAADVAGCRCCARLVDWRESCESSARAIKGAPYWAKGVPGFGDPKARLAIVGLAPAANGANRTGRMFTGDRSGDFLFASLHRTGFANQSTSVDRDDGLSLSDAYITSVVHCAPPQNKPTNDERDNCVGYLAEELAALGDVRVIVCLGAFSFQAVTRLFRDAGRLSTKVGQTRFSHGGEFAVAPNDPQAGLTLLGSYHPSQRNVFTGLLSAPALDDVFHRARQLISV